MKILKVCFVGVGSIAERHIANLYSICKERKCDLQLDIFRSGKGKKITEKTQKYVNHIYTDIEKVQSDYDVIFITNPTDYHIRTLKLFHEKGKSFFIEKPLTSIQRLDELTDFEFRKSTIYYIACPLRYMKVIQYVDKNIDKNQVYSVRCISSSYLPEWRQGVDYRDTYSAKEKMGGGVSIDLVHEWDYIQYLFGMPDKVQKIFAKKSDLEIETEDIAVYIAEYKNKIVELHLDYFGRSTIRKMELFMKDDTVECDLVNGKIKFLKSQKEICLEEDRDGYQKRELECFLDMIAKKHDNINSQTQAFATLKLTQGETK